MPKTSKKMTGLSLSLCVAQIARGDVDEANVLKIVAATKASDLETFERVLDHYCRNYWVEFPEKAREIAMRFWDKNLIDQPRTRDEPCHYIGDGKWMDEENNTFEIRDGKRLYSGKKLRVW